MNKTPGTRLVALRFHWSTATCCAHNRPSKPSEPMHRGCALEFSGLLDAGLDAYAAGRGNNPPPGGEVADPLETFRAACQCGAVQVCSHAKSKTTARCFEFWYWEWADSRVPRVSFLAWLALVCFHLMKE